MLSEETKRAMRQASQTKLGTEFWADMFIRIAEADDPQAVAAEYTYRFPGEAVAYGLRSEKIDPLIDMDI